MSGSRVSLSARALAAALGMFLFGAYAYAQGCPSNSAIAQPRSPANTSVTGGTKVHYQWSLSTANNAVGYEVYVRQSGNTGGGTRDCAAASPNDSCDGSILPAGNYEWSVRTLATSCANGVDSSFQPFTVATFCGAPNAPTLLSPSDKSTVSANPPTLNWTSIATAGSYDIHIGNSVFTSTTNSFTPQTLAPGTYSWYVEAIASCDNTKRTRSTSTFDFTVPTCPDAVTLQSPAEGASVSAGSITLTWKAPTSSAAAPTYNVFAGIDGGNAVFVGSTTNTSLTRTIDGGKSIEWFVVSSYPNCPDKTSAHGHFTTVASCPTAAPSITAPASGAAFDDSKPVTINWTAVTNATSYDVLVSTDNGANFTPKTSVTSTTTSIALGAGTYVVTIRANALSCPSLTSPVVRFTVTTTQACPTTNPFLTSPADNATVTLPVTFQWTAVAGASSYNVYVIQPRGDDPFTLVGTTTKTELTASSLPIGVTAWFVRAVGDGCPATESARNNITVSTNSTCPTTAPTLVSPANGAANVANPVQFDWSDVANATNYRLVVSFNDGNPTPIAFTTDSKFSASLPAGEYSWFVEAIFGTTCPAIQSQHFSFNVVAANACATTGPTLTSPADGATNVSSPVTLQWTAVTGATEYKVFASVANSVISQIGETTATQLTVQAPAGTFTWFVEAILGGDCSPVVSKRATFTVTTGSCQNAPPTLQSPSDGAANVTSPVKFQWSNVDGATLYSLFVSYNNGSFERFGQTTDHDAERIIPPGSIAWYVVASFNGCPDQKSSTFHFTVPNATSCPTGSITLNTPADGATVASPVTLSWSAITGATSYRVYASLNGAAFVIVAHPATNSAAVALPSGAIEWYVEALFTGNTTTSTCPSITSQHAKFTVSRAATCDNNKAAVATAPTGSIATTNVDFTWTAAAGATAYRVWIAPAGQPFGDVGFTKDAHLTRSLDAGSYSWYVEAFFDGCPTLASNKLDFTITTARCSTNAPSLISPADGATNVTSPVTLLWSSVPGAQLYRVFASLDNGPEVLIGQTTDTSLTKSVLPGTIRWRVEVSFAQCTSTKSGTSTFTVPRAQNCTGEAAQLVSPIDGATLTDPEVDLLWNAVNGAKRYVVFVRHNDGAPTAIAETEDTHVHQRAPEGKIEWWVVTFVTGCDAKESAHSTFNVTAPNNCDNKKPLLQSPQDNSVVTQPVIFNWSPVANATGYRVFAALGDDEPSLVDSTTTLTQSKPIALPSGIIHWFVEATFANCPATRSAVNDFRVITPPACGTPAKPLINVAASVASDTQYVVRWTFVPNSDKYELEEAQTPDFSTATTFIVSGNFQSFTHSATTAPVQYLYRVRALSNCSDDRGAFSNVIGIVILPPQQNGNTEAGGTSKVITKVFLAGSSAPLQFTATSDKPWITITPPSGTIPTAGLTLTITADPGPLNLGTNTGTIKINYAGPTSSNRATPLVTVVNIPVSVSLVTPVSSTGKNTPPPDSLIVPAIGHATGIGNSLFESDVRLANTSAQLMKYQLNFTPAGADGTTTGSSTQIQVDPGATMALNDVLANFFGGGSAPVGTLEIRPLTSTTATSAFASTSTLSQSLTTVVSSRTYNATTTGTFGQFIPAIPFGQFIGKAADNAQKQILSLQQIAQSSAYRTNFGVVEGSGEPVSVLLTVFDAAGNKLGTIPKDLPAGGFIQFNNLLAENGITLSDGRVEVEVTSATGRVTAYASVLDNITSDPLLVSPVSKSTIGSNRYVLPGIGDFDIGIAHWKSDVRLYNAGSAKTDATLSYYPQGAPGSPRTTTISIDPGEMKVMNDFIANTFPMNGTAGSLVVTTPQSSSIVATARTYTDQGANKGTYGQFIPAVTPTDSTSLGGRTLQVLQLEASDQFRTNIGLVETSGKPVSVEVSVILPDSRVTPKTTYNLAANEFRQISLGADFGLSNVYNVRATVRVLSGTGSVTSYGSVIDSTTQDPTYVPAQ